MINFSARSFCICSDKSVDNLKDTLSSSIEELGFTGLGVTTESRQIKKLLSSKKTIVVFSTYQSLTELQKAIRWNDGEKLEKVFRKISLIRKQIIEAGQAEFEESKKIK